MTVSTGELFLQTNGSKRMPFVNAERTGTFAGVADVVAKMGTGAKDDIATWFVVG